mmetsp:Transcript_86300/g.252470  ORF Transcript_86300/g.252470 Transcript_86300/m.252470 type:complete len:350 (+) Transcript_86300:71-1120(+)
MRSIAAAIPAVLAVQVVSLRVLQQAPDEPTFIPRTEVPKPHNYNNYTRGKQPWPLFHGKPEPAHRPKFDRSLGQGIPEFDHHHRDNSPELFVEASPNDIFGHQCSPGGTPAGHYIYNVWDPELVPFVVEPGTKGRTDTAVIIAPGGGNVHLSWEPEGISQAEWLNSLGISAFVLKYRVPCPDTSLNEADLQRAVGLVRKRARELDLNGSRIGFLGFGRGGHMGLQLASAEKRLTSSLEGSQHHPPATEKLAFLLLVYPEMPGHTNYAELTSFPPTFLAFAEDDTCYPALVTRIYSRILLSVAPTMKVLAHKTGGHGWADCAYYPSLKKKHVCKWREAAEDFLNKHVLNL